MVWYANKAVLVRLANSQKIFLLRVFDATARGIPWAVQPSSQDWIIHKSEVRVTSGAPKMGVRIRKINLTLLQNPDNLKVALENGHEAYQVKKEVSSFAFERIGVRSTNWMLDHREASIGIMTFSTSGYYSLTTELKIFVATFSQLIRKQTSCFFVLKKKG